MINKYLKNILDKNEYINIKTEKDYLEFREQLKEGGYSVPNKNLFKQYGDQLIIRAKGTTIYFATIKGTSYTEVPVHHYRNKSSNIGGW